MKNYFLRIGKCFMAFLLIFLVSFTAIVYADTPDEWAKPFIERGISLKLVPAEFQTDYTKSIMRLDFCVMVMNLLEVTTGKEIKDLVEIPEKAFRDVDNEYVAAAYALKIVSGTGNGKFSPYNSLTRQEAAVIITNAAKAVGIWKEVPRQKYSDGYLVAGWAETSVDYVSYANIMNGVGANLFAPTSLYTKQQTVSSIVRAYDYFIEVVGASASISGTSVFVGEKEVRLGMSLDKVMETFGNPTELLESVHGHTWYVFADDYENFIMIGINGKESAKKVAAIATNAKNFKYGDVSSSYDYDKATKAYPNAAFFKDTLKTSGKTFVDGILVYGSEFFYSSADFGDKKDIFLKTFSKENFYFTNSYRAKIGLKAFAYSDLAEKAAVNHSVDQARRSLMTHTGSDGSTTSTRLNNAGIQWKSCAENVAYGQYNGIFAYEGWLNSESHRQTLEGSYDFMGCGAALSSGNAIYYTQNFYSPL